MLRAVAAGADLALALVSFARGAEALGGVGERERDEERKRCEGGEEDPPSRSFGAARPVARRQARGAANWPGCVRTEKATCSACARGEVAREGDAGGLSE
jgi:hypothetical protein